MNAQQTELDLNKKPETIVIHRTMKDIDMVLDKLERMRVESIRGGQDGE